MEFSAVNTIWVLLGAALVFFMQAGFAMVETGFTRAKNAGNIIMKNLMDFCIGTPVFWLVGFGLMFGDGNGFIGSIKGIASASNYGTGMLPDGIPFFAFLIFQTVFCATAATIVSGAMAERTKFISYCLYSFVISLVVYPIEAHWIWGGGWLAEMGFHDFAGSTAVHMCGGAAALVGAWILGPRIGKYGKDGKPKAIPGHSLTLGALGVFILWFCWFGFNGASTVSMTGDSIVTAGKIFVTTNLAAAVATCTVMIITWIRYKKPDVSMTLNGSLAGLVAITAGCDTVSPASAAIIGIIAGFVVVFGLDITEHNLESSYADFMPASIPSVLGSTSASKKEDTKETKISVSEAVPVQLVSDDKHMASDVKLSKVDIICKQSKFEDLKDALNSIGVMGITVTQVLGCGAQKGNTKYYRGVEVDMVLLPKVKVEVVVSKVPVMNVVNAAKKALYTGNIGDGKIFIYDVENVVKVRTGEQGFDALQGDNDLMA